MKDEFLESLSAIHPSPSRETIDLNKRLKPYIVVKDDLLKSKALIFENTGI